MWGVTQISALVPVPLHKGVPPHALAVLAISSANKDLQCDLLCLVCGFVAIIPNTIPTLHTSMSLPLATALTLQNSSECWKEGKQPCESHFPKEIMDTLKMRDWNMRWILLDGWLQFSSSSWGICQASEGGQKVQTSVLHNQRTQGQGWVCPKLWAHTQPRI